MSTINEETNLADAEDAGAQGALAADIVHAQSTQGAAAIPTGAPATDGADDGEIERELQQMEDAAVTLQKEGMISESEAAEKRDQVERTRKLFRDLSPAERAAIVQRRREIGRELMARQLSGAAVVKASVRLNHTRLKPLFEQWWPYLNRMSINMQRFGRSTFGADDQGTVTSWFEKQIGDLEAYVDEQLTVVREFRQKTETKMRD